MATDKTNGDALNPQLLDEAALRKHYALNADVKIERYVLAEHPFVLWYCEGMADRRQISEFVLPHLERMLDKGPIDALPSEKTLELTPFDWSQGSRKLDDLLFSGQLLLFFEDRRLLLSLDIANPPKRDPEESSIEVSIKGPRDGFTEDLSTNMSLVRKRIKTRVLCMEQMTLGSKSQTKVAFLYVSDMADPAVVTAVRDRLGAFQTDALISGEQLEEGLSGSYSLVPLLDHTGRPDLVAESLLRGRVAVLLEGYPMAVLAPATLTSILKSPEDLHLPFYYVFFQRLLRLVSLITTILLPGFWVATSAFQLDQIPFPLLATITVARLGVPLSGPVDLFLMLGLFELFREAGIRLPKAVGQTVAVVGGLFVGDAAITAGLTSPTALVVSAITLVSSFTLVNQSLTGSVTIIRFFILICSSLLGMYGFFLGLFAVILYVAGLESFGVPYLAPVSPLKVKKLVPAILINPWNKLRKRPVAARPEESAQKGDSA